MAPDLREPRAALLADDLRGRLLLPADLAADLLVADFPDFPDFFPLDALVAADFFAEVPREVVFALADFAADDFLPPLRALDRLTLYSLSSGSGILHPHASRNRCVFVQAR